MSPRPAPTKCRLCGRDVFAATAGDGSVLLIDARPDPVGGFFATINHEGGITVTPLLPGEGFVGRNRYTSHHATCSEPAADMVPE